ncbi:hypothetical protein PanWU01x14_151410 [Parasponia andersonii]|uniref:Uncharacterized protein n=1 Tax=Parasponia andersonii TaxID=3476 RepID=A0A2P5CHK4_PARAD|nr:hypothetical protein PanWU01x14_151410 [Parasponia andersonii]
MQTKDYKHRKRKRKSNLDRQIPRNRDAAITADHRHHLSRYSPRNQILHCSKFFCSDKAWAAEALSNKSEQFLKPQKSKPKPPCFWNRPHLFGSGMFARSPSYR